jgi:hypothetical protein
MKYFSIENSVDRVHGLIDRAAVDRAAPWSTVDRRHRAQLELAERRHAAPKLTAMARGGRRRRRGAHRGQNRAARWRGCVDGGEEWNTTSVLGVGQLGARMSGARWGKMLQGKWPRRRHLLYGRRGDRGEGKRCGEGNGRRRFINVPIMREEARGRPFDEGEMKGVGRRFSSTPTGCGSSVEGGR